MKKTEKNTDQQPVTIGFPRALLFYRYEVLWTRFFGELGIPVLISSPTNRAILEAGTAVTVDECCLSTKVYMGHIRELLGKCDYILIPYICNMGIQRCFCTKFHSLYDLVQNTFRNSNQKLLSYRINEEKKETEETAFMEMAEELSIPKKAAKDAYKNAKKAEREDWKNRVREQEQLYKQEGLKVLIAGHSYIIEDAYIGGQISSILEQMGILPIRADIVDRKEALKQSLKMSPTLQWEMSREIVGSIQMHRDKIDGIVLVSAFPCGPDSMVNDMITRKMEELPVLNLVLDSQSGMAGIETRLESFADILKFRKGAL